MNIDVTGIVEETIDQTIEEKSKGDDRDNPGQGSQARSGGELR